MDEPAEPAPPAGVRGWYLAHELWVLYVVAAVSYTLVAMYEKLLLNWIIGPIWPVLVVWFGPVVVRKVTRWEDPLP